MADENWQKVRDIFDSALRRKPGERQNYLIEVCGADKILFAEVKSLLSALDSAENFMETPAVAKVADAFAAEIKVLEKGKCFGHYEIIRQIGAGGMGEVYLATDKKLDRQVAVKILNEKFSRDESNLRRFISEAKAASALNHPNILTIYEFGEAEDAHFIVSEFIKGKTLREIFKGKSLHLSEVLDISIQIANALCTAHEVRLVHRDIKPENIMIRPDGYVKILDFGLAKLVEQKNKSILGLEDETARQNQTAKGMILGTVNYMSPEQAKGERVDERTDIFSFGVVIYEMIAGRTPFAGDSMPETIANLINKEPPPLIRFSANVPDELQRIVAKTLKKNKAVRYQTMRDVLTDLKEFRENLAFDEKLERSAASNENATAILQIATSEAVNQPTDATQNSLSLQIRRKPFAAALLLVMLVGAVGFGFWYFAFRTAVKKQIESIAVMPFINESGNADVEYLSDGMTETLISSLSQLPNLDVKARSSVFRYKGKETNVNAVARELNVQAFLNGKVRERDNDLSFYIELVDAATEKVIWSQTYNRPLANLVALQNEISRDAADKLKTKLSNADEQKLAKNYTTNAEAYQLFLKGRFYLGKRTKPDVQKAVEYFEQSVAADPNYALGYAELGNANWMFSSYHNAPRNEARQKAKDAVLNAISLDPELGEAHAALGLILSENDLAGAEREYLRAIELNPNYATVYLYYHFIFVAQGKFEEALAMQRRALEIEPFSLIINREYGATFFSARRYDEAITQFKKTAELDAGFPSVHYYLAVTYQMKGNYAEAVAEHAKYQELIGEPNKAALLRESFAKSGWQGFLSTITDEQQQFDLSWDNLIPYYVALGDKDKAFALLNKFADTGVKLRQLKIDPRLDSLRDDSRYDELIRRVKSK